MPATGILAAVRVLMIATPGAGKGTQGAFRGAEPPMIIFPALEVDVLVGGAVQEHVQKRWHAVGKDDLLALDQAPSKPSGV
jgi:hypothetical protein